MLIYDVLHKETIYQTVVSDLRNFGVKYRFKKNAFKTERNESAKNISRKVFKTSLLYQPLDVVNLASGGIVHVPVFVSQASAFLEKHITQEGLFRKAGSQVRQKELMARLDNGGTLGEKPHAVDVANCLKSFFRDLPEPLIPFMYHDLFVHCAMLKTSRVQALLLACILLPPHHLNTLAFFMEFLKKVSLYEKQNKMGVDNLAKVIGPNIMPLQEATMSAVQTRLELHLVIVKMLIENAANIGVLPDHIAQSLSMETIGSTDNDLDVSDCQSRSKSRKKKHRSGSLTRMFNGLRKIVGKGGSPEENNTSDNQQVPVNYDPLFISNIKSTKKRKVAERLDPQSTKKKRIAEKADKSKKLRLSLDRFVPKTKHKLIDDDPESYVNTFNTCTERRWSSVSNSYDSQRKHRTFSDASSQLKTLLKDNDASNAELQREYNNMFLDADVNLSDDSNEQVLLTKEDRVNTSRCRTRLSSSLEELKIANNFDQIPLYTSKQKLILNDLEAYSTHVKMSSTDDQSEEYVRIPKSEYEEIKNRVSAIESCISQEFGCSVTEETCNLSAHSVKKVQTAYEKTLEEASIESTASTDYLARRLGKELKIRRSGEQKIIRSPSARKIGNLRRRSQEKIMSKRVRRTASWHISHGMDSTSQIQPDREITKSSSNHVNDICLPRNPSSPWKEVTNDTQINNLHERHNHLNHHMIKNSEGNRNLNSFENEVVHSPKNRNTSVRRVSSFHGNEFTKTALYFEDKVEKLRKTNSQQNIILNNPCLMKANFKPDGRREGAVSWKDAERYFKSSTQVSTPVTQTGRASIAKLRAQNAGMVLAKAKLFDECTTKVSTQSNPNKKYEWTSGSNHQSVITSKHKETDKHSLDSLDQVSKRTDASSRRTNKTTKIKNTKISCINSPSRVKLESGNTHVGMDEERDKTNYYQYVSHESDVLDSKMCQVSKEKINVPYQQKENILVKTPPFVRKVSTNSTSHDSRLNIYKPDSNTLCKTPHIKKPLTVKTPKSAKALSRKSIVDSRRTPLKAVGQLGSSKYQSPKSILKTRNGRHA